MSRKHMNPTENLNLGYLLAETSSVLIWVSDDTKQCVYFNKAWLDFRGRTLEEEYGYGWADGVHPDDMERCLSIFTTAFDNRDPFSMDYRLKSFDGSFKWIRDNGSPSYNEDSIFTGYIGTCFDITEIIESKQRAEENEHKLSLLTESINEVFWMSEPGVSEITYISQGFERIWGYSTAELLNNPKLFIDSINEEDKHAFLKVISDKHSNGIPYEMTYRINNREGHLRWIHERGYPVVNEQGATTHMTGVCTDITEKMDLESQLKHMEKIDAIGQLAGGVAHDFNNQLGGIMGFAEMIYSKAKDEELKDFASKIINAAFRSSELTSKLLTFSRKRDYQKTEFDIHNVIHETVSILELTIDRLIQIDLNLLAKKSIIKGDTSEIQNVCLNLALNARDAMPEGGVLTFETSTKTLRENSDFCKKNELLGGEYIAVAISDTGTGMSEEVKHHLFEPYFTTKAEKKGTGMGLASAYGAIKQHEGCINFKSMKGKGTTFEILLPIRNIELLDDDSSSEPVLKQLTPLKILAIDDLAIIRDMYIGFLEVEGHSVITAENGLQAIDIYEKEWSDIDLVILDMMMPKMNGLETYKLLKKINNEVKVLLATAYSLEDQSAEILEMGAAGFIQKPFKRVNLLSKIQSIIHQVQ